MGFCLGIRGGWRTEGEYFDRNFNDLFSINLTSLPTDYDGYFLSMDDYIVMNIRVFNNIYGYDMSEFVGKYHQLAEDFNSTVEILEERNFNINNMSGFIDISKLKVFLGTEGSEDEIIFFPWNNDKMMIISIPSMNIYNTKNKFDSFINKFLENFLRI